MSTPCDEEMANKRQKETARCSLNSKTERRESGDLSGSVFLISSDGKILSLPIPTKSRQDPLNWTKMKQARAFTALYIFAITGHVMLEGPTYLFGPLRDQFPIEDHPSFQVQHLISSPKLFMGIGAWIWIPLSLAIGRRPVFLLSTVLSVIAALGAGISGTFYHLLVASCLQGFAQGVTTSMALLMIIDITFIHQRPQAIAMFWCLVACMTDVILALVPLLVKSGSTWREFYFQWSVPAAVSSLLAFFFYPETYFIRPPIAFDGRILVQSATEKVQIYEDWAEAPGGKALPDMPRQSQWVQDLKFWGLTRGGWRAMRQCYSQALGCLVNPLIFWVAILNALVLASVLSIGETYLDILCDPPYKFSAHAVALVHLAAAVGSLAAWPASGVLIAWVSRQLAMRNRGVRDAEHYLPAFILPITTGMISVIIYGLASEHKWHYMWIIFAYGLNSFTFVSLATADTLWVTEAFPRWAAPALVVLSGLSNMASFGISFGINPWIRSQGLSGADLEIGLMIAVVGFIVVPVAFWGKKLRQHIDGRWGLSEKGALRPQ